MTLDTADPQVAQKGLPSRISASHEGHRGATRAPQFAQKGLSLGVSPWHTSHCMMALPGSAFYDVETRGCPVLLCDQYCAWRSATTKGAIPSSQKLPRERAAQASRY